MEARLKKLHKKENSSFVTSFWDWKIVAAQECKRTKETVIDQRCIFYMGRI